MCKEWGQALRVIKSIQHKTYVFREFMVLEEQVDSTPIFFTFKTKTESKLQDLA